MSEPTRLRDDGPDEVRALLRTAAPTRAITTAQRARTASRVARYAAVMAAAGSLSWLPGAAFGAGLGAVVAIGAFVVPDLIAPGDAPAPHTSAVVAVKTGPAGEPAAVVAASASASVSAPADRPSARVPPVASAAAPPSVASAAAPLPGEDPLAQEAALIEQARATLGGNPGEALAIAESHAARFPNGKLAMERELVAIDALRRLGRAGEARARGEAVLARAKGSLYEPRIRKLIEGDPR